jgi:uncharacterized protein YkwD
MPTHRAPARHRRPRRFLPSVPHRVVAAAAAVLVAGSAVTISAIAASGHPVRGTATGPPPPTTTRSSAAPTTAATTPAGRARPLDASAHRARVTIPEQRAMPTGVRIRPSATPTTGSRPATSSRPSRPRTTAPPPTASASSSAPSGGGGSGSGSIAAAVVAAINAARAQNGLPALAVYAGLQSSAHTHNLAMVAANELSHQLPGEADLGTRESNAGVSWTSAGENIGWNSDMSQAGALALEASMLAETPPNDGHRRNILSSTFTVVGVDVYLDATHGRLWLTEDFARLR